MGQGRELARVTENERVGASVCVCVCVCDTLTSLGIELRRKSVPSHKGAVCVSGTQRDRDLDALWSQG